MLRSFPALVLVSAVACAACGDVTLKDPDAPDAGADVTDAREGDVPDAQPGAPDARPVITPDARVPDAGDPSTSCVDGDTQIEDPNTGACYMFFSTPRTWNAAAAACASLGADTHLIALTSPDEHQIAIDVTPDLLGVWLGATDSGSEGLFVWITGELVDFSVWATGEPNNGGTNGENCAILINSGTRAGLWDDRSCDVALPYLCERE